MQLHLMLTDGRAANLDANLDIEVDGRAGMWKLERCLQELAGFEADGGHAWFVGQSKRRRVEGG